MELTASTKAPPSVVRRKVSIDQVLHEISLAHSPVQHKVLSQEGAYNHTASIVHPPTMIQLPHRSIHNRIARVPIVPRFKVLLVILPFNICVFRLERLVHAHEWPVSHDVFIEVPPSNFTNPSLNSFGSAIQLLSFIVISCDFDCSPCAESAAGEMNAEGRGTNDAWKVALVLVFANSRFRELG